MTHWRSLKRLPTTWVSPWKYYRLQFYQFSLFFLVECRRKHRIARSIHALSNFVSPCDCGKEVSGIF